MGTVRSNNLSKAEIELSVFRKFAEVCSLPIMPASIQQPAPPHSDLICELGDGHSVAFELAEIVDSSLMKRLKDKLELENKLKQAFMASPISGFDDANVVIIFASDVSSQKRRSAVPTIFEILASLPNGYSGKVPLRKGTKLNPVTNIVVSRGFQGGPYFGVSDVGSYGDPTIQIIKGKLEKQYETNFPLELLVYYNLQVSNYGSNWAPSLATLEPLIEQSHFRRVWVFNIQTDYVEWVYPPIQEG